MAKNLANKSSVVKTIPLNAFLTIAFIEGGAVMAIELLGAKMVAPFYGASLYVWTSIFITTLGGLASGYFLGGRAATYLKKEFILFVVLLTGATFIALMPVIAPGIMEATFSIGIRAGSLISCLTFMLVPLICMGMVSPLIIELASLQIKNAGKSAGTIYAVSTLGGILATLLLGFFIIPEFGIKKPLLFSAAILALCPLMYFFTRKKTVASVICIAVFILIGGFAKPKKKSPDENIIKYYSEGLLGQVMVMDIPMIINGKEQTSRKLFVNRITQTHTLPGNAGISLWSYPHRISMLASIKPKGSKALVLGYGAGSNAFEMLGLGFETKAVELDKRIKEVAAKYFFADEKRCPVIIDDARHYLRTSNEKFDVVIFDLLRGDEQPSYVLTIETMNGLKKILNKDALVIVNYQGEVKGPMSLAARSVFRTLKEAGFDTKYFFEKAPEEGLSDLIFVASAEKLPDFSDLQVERQNKCCQAVLNAADAQPLNKMISDYSIAINDALILTDDKPVLETINNPTLELWRKSMINDLTKPLMDAGIPLFK